MLKHISCIYNTSRDAMWSCAAVKSFLWQGGVMMMWFMRRVLHVGYRFVFTAEMNERHSSRGSNPLSQLLARFNSLGDKACAHPGVQSKRSA